MNSTTTEKRSHNETRKRNDRLSRLAREYGVSRATLWRDVQFTQGVEHLALALGPDIQRRILAGEISNILSKQDVILLGRIPLDKLCGLSDKQLKELARKTRKPQSDVAAVTGVQRAYLRLTGAQKKDFTIWLAEQLRGDV